MHNDPVSFFTGLGQLYSVYPNFFYAIGVGTVAVILGAFWLGWQLQRSGKDGLREQVKAVEQQKAAVEEWRKFAMAKLETTEKEAKAATDEVAGLKKQIENNAPTLALTNSTTHLSVTLNRLVAANSELAHTLSNPGVGYDTGGPFSGHQITLPSD
jgi:hypothetical protein